MQKVFEQRVRLESHPATPFDAVNCFEVRVCRDPSGILALRYVVEGDIRRIRVPQRQSTPQRTDGLWKHTCFEVFVAEEGIAGYREYNFAPSGNWAAYTFSAYREGMAPLVSEWEPQIRVEASDGVLILDSSLPVSPVASLRLALSAVLEDEQGNVSYWAARHPQGKPDFHHPDSFVIEI